MSLSQRGGPTVRNVFQLFYLRLARENNISNVLGTIFDNVKKYKLSNGGHCSKTWLSSDTPYNV